MGSTEPQDGSPAGSAEPLSGGRLLSAISTRFVQLLREYYGRGPIKAKTYALDDIIVVVLRGSGFTPLERTVMDSGEASRVVAMREQFQDVMESRYTEAIEELTWRKVQAFMSQAHLDPDVTLEVFSSTGRSKGSEPSRSPTAAGRATPMGNDRCAEAALTPPSGCYKGVVGGCRA